MQVKLEDFSVPAELANQNNQDNGFIKSKSNEKKDKKTKLAEEKKRAREREAEKAAANDYIAGMEGSVQPADKVVANKGGSGVFTINDVNFESPDEILREKIIEAATKHQNVLARIVAKNKKSIQEILKEDSNPDIKSENIKIESEFD